MAKPAQTRQHWTSRWSTAFHTAAANAGASLNDLPNSVPDAYFDFLRGVNPQEPGVEHRLTHEQMFEAAGILARQALGEDFVPRDFTLTKAREALARKRWKGPERADPIERLIQNGVLTSRYAGGDTLLRFALDPVAEFLAATAWDNDCGDDPKEWQKLMQKVLQKGKPADGFATAVRLTRLRRGKPVK